MSHKRRQSKNTSRGSFYHTDKERMTSKIRDQSKNTSRGSFYHFIKDNLAIADNNKF